MNPTQQNAAKKPQLPLVDPASAKDNLRATMADVERLTAECEEKERALTDVRWTLEEAHAEVARLKARGAEDAARIAADGAKFEDAQDAIVALSESRNDLERRLRDAERNAGPLTRAATIGDLASALTRGSIFALRFIPQGARMAVQCYPSPYPTATDIPALAVNGESVEDALTCLVSAVRPN